VYCGIISSHTQHTCRSRLLSHSLPSILPTWYHHFSLRLPLSSTECCINKCRHKTTWPGG